MGCPFWVIEERGVAVVKKFTRDERNSLIEKGKTVIIALLCVCCVCLLTAVLDLYKGQVSMGTFFWGKENTAGLSRGQENTTQNVVNTFWQLSEPEAVLAVSGNGRRIVKKTDRDYEQIIEKINMTVRDIYSVRAADILASDAKQWNDCLAGNAVYVKFTAPRVTNFEGLFYGVKDSGLSRAVSACGEIIFVPDTASKSALNVYIKDADADKIVKISMQTDAEVFRKAIGDSAGRGREFDFGFELKADRKPGIPELADMFVVPEGAVETSNILINVPRIYKSGINFTRATEVTTGLINIFGYNPNTVRQYANTDGALIYVGETGSLSLHPLGRIEYKALGENEGVSIAAGDLNSASAYSVVAGLSEVIEKICNLSGVKDEKNDAQLRITDFRQDGMEFDYFVDGVRVSMGNGAAVSAVIKNGVLTEFKMWVKVIEKTENTTQSQPVMTAVQDYCRKNPGARSVNSGELIYRYNGDDNETSAVWDIQGEL